MSHRQLSAETISTITEKVMEKAGEWQMRLLEAVFPQAEIQKCIVHQIRNSLRFLPWKERKAVDLKRISTASSVETDMQALVQFSEGWDSKYPHIAKSWNANWAELSTFYKYSPEIKKLIYTINPIESFNRSLRKVTKTRTIFPNGEACLKLVFLAIQDIEKKMEPENLGLGKNLLPAGHQF